MSDPTPTPTTDDAFFDGALRLFQPADGYRAAIDPILLAAATGARAGDAVADIGCGVGTAALCLTGRIDGLTVDGLEIQSDLAALARRNGDRNGVGDRLTVIDGDVAARPVLPGKTGYDHVLTNPPYGDGARERVSPHPGKAVAHTGTGVELDTWVGYCLSLLKPKGNLTLIHRADALDRLLACCAGRLGEIVIYPLWPKAGRAAKRVILRGRKGVATPLRLSPGLVLHNDDGSYTPRAERLLRTPTGLDLTARGGESS